MKKSSRPLRTATSNNDLVFPTLNSTMAPPSIRSMDEINSWIEQDYLLFFNRDQYTQEKEKMSVQRRFELKFPGPSPTAL